MRVRVAEHACRRRLGGLSYESEGGQAVKSGSKLIAGIPAALLLERGNFLALTNPLYFSG
jgi:hypothetical protein